MKNKRIALFVCYVALGAVLIGLGFAEVVDEFWSGMGSAILVVGALRLLRMYRLRNNEAYREKVVVETTDERNQFIRSKAWAWAGYLFILIAGISVIVLKIVGLDQFSQAASCAVCLLLVLYWGAFLALRKKY